MDVVKYSQILAYLLFIFIWVFKSQSYQVINVNTKDLQYYHALVQTKNFSKVAQQFGVRQPTITSAIKRLEDYYQTTFFIRDRSHNQLTVTNNGHQFDRHVQIILNELSVAHKEIDRASNQQILFGLPPIIGNYYFPPLAPQISRQGLMGQLEIVEHGSADLLRMMQHGDIDLALMGSITPLNLPQLSVRTIQRQPINIIVSKEHPLAQRAETGVYFKDLAKENFIMFDEGFVHNQAFRMMERLNHIRPRISYKTTDVHVLKAMVAENIGISYLTSLAVIPTNNLVQVPLLDHTNPEFLISCVRRDASVLNESQQTLWDLLTKAQ